MTAKPGNDGSKGNPAVVVEGSPVTVEPCVSQSGSLDLGVTPECLAPGEALARYTLANAGPKEVTVDVTLDSGMLSFDLQYTVAPNASLTIPATDGFTADGKWTHIFSAVCDGEEITVNGEPMWEQLPDCS